MIYFIAIRGVSATQQGPVMNDHESQAAGRHRILTFVHEWRYVLEMSRLRSDLFN
ncbi:hypothetical protein OG417_45115 [Actinoallomurus sp. NBC_01490]|uniref:hypothetical protein n=1 Tax=Actinoallomurus sp. NBC_01490 TaxID=2903557 RepID=UPI002E381179|nr:hypothetical protein [Actinoallomurus sp. NBC_01490]